MGKSKFKTDSDKRRDRKVTTGTVIGHPKGFGFVTPDDKSADVYLPVFEMNGVLHGDRVEVEVKHKRNSDKLNGKVVKVIERAQKRICGAVKSHNKKLYVQPLDKRISHDIYVDKQSLAEVRVGDIVEVEISQYPDHKNHLLVGKISQVFGDVKDSKMPITLAVYKHQIPNVWPKEVLQDSLSCPVAVDQQIKQSRTDLSDHHFVTIDGETAKDFDDAILVRKVDEGYVLYVAIADVSSYIKPGTALDQTAYERGTSVYFPEHVIPMLPENYSNGICSLNPGVDRLVLVCQIELDHAGNQTDFQFYEAVINSKSRLTYNQVWDYLSETDTEAVPEPVRADLDAAYELFQKLFKLRTQRGALDLDIPENTIEFDDAGKVKSLLPLVRNNAHRLIEEFMLAANVCAAQILDEKLGTGIFRVHERPDDERVSDLRYFLSDFGLDLPVGDRPTSHDFSRVLENKLLRQEWVSVISSMILRTQKQAHYSEQMGLHFALNYPAYTHFTSPIRRYPDLIVHRLIKAIIKNRKPAAQLLDQLTNIADQCSARERRAEEASREVISYYKLQFLQSHLGDEFSGVITGVSNFGFFVELDEVLTSGLVHVTTLSDDFYVFDPLKHQLIGERSGRVFKVGQRVDVVVSRVDLEDKKLDLIVPAMQGAKTGKKKKHQSKRHSRAN